MTTTIRFHEYGTPDVLKPEDDQIGPPGPGQVRLRHEAIGVNFIDTAFRQGVFPMPLPGVTDVEQGRVAPAIEAVFDAYREGVFGNYKATVYPLREAAAAHRDIAARRKSGPMILVP